jgi:hypothetical protein
MKRETVEEFLARGGVIKKIPSVDTSKPEIIKALGSVTVNFITMEEAELYNEPEKVTARKTAKKKAPVDLSALPKELLDKFMKEALDAQE